MHAVLPVAPFLVEPVESTHTMSLLRAVESFPSNNGTTEMSKSLQWCNSVLCDDAVPMNVVGAAWHVRLLEYSGCALTDEAAPVGRLRVTGMSAPTELVRVAPAPKPAPRPAAAAPHGDALSADDAAMLDMLDGLDSKPAKPRTTQSDQF